MSLESSPNLPPEQPAAAEAENCNSFEILWCPPCGKEWPGTNVAADWQDGYCPTKRDSTNGWYKAQHTPETVERVTIEIPDYPRDIFPEEFPE